MNTLIFYIYLFFGLAILFWILLLNWYKKQKKYRDASAGLKLALFLVSLPEAEEKDKDPAEAAKKFIEQMEQFLSGLTIVGKKDLGSRLWGGAVLALEIAAHNRGGEIFFYVAFPRTYSKVLESQVHGIFPSAKIEQVHDYNIFNLEGYTSGATVTSDGSELLPIKTYQKLGRDPLETVTAAFSHLKEFGEGAALQILLRQESSNIKNRAHKAAEKIKKGENPKAAIYGESFWEGAKDLIFPKSSKKKEEKTQISYDEEKLKLLEEKSSKIAYECNVRLLASAKTSEAADNILKEMEAAFLQFQNPEGNAFKVKELRGKNLNRAIEKFSFRIFDDARAITLNTEEIASIYHFPYTKKSAIGVRTLKSKEAPPPLELPAEGVIIGKSSYRGEERPVRIRKDDRRRHFYIVGQTGTGKTTLMSDMIKQDIVAGEGVGVIDPHGDLIEDILGNIPQERLKDVIVFDPGDIGRPLGLNILEIDPDQPQQKSFVIDDFYKILRMIYKDIPEAFGPIFEKFFKNTIMLLLDDYKNEIPTIAEISRVFADKEYRDTKLSRETNPEIVRFWKYEAEKMSGEWSLPNMSGYITSKFSPFIINEYLRPIITQQKSAFNLRDIMDNKKILLVNLSKGLIGDINANLLGMILVSKILVAAFSRVNIPNQEERQDFYLYIDEFQNFTTDSISTILSEARKYRLNLNVAHQYIKQLEEGIKNAVFGTVGSMAVFRVGIDDAEALKAQFEGTFSPQDLINIDNFNAYAKILINNQTSKPFNIKIIPPAKGSPEIASAAKEFSRSVYGRDRDKVEQEFRVRQGV